MNRFHFSPLTGHAYIDQNGRATHVIDLKVGELQSAKGTHIDMWMQGKGDIEEMDAGEYPFTVAIEGAMKRRRQENARRFLGYCLDPQESLHARREAGGIVEDRTADAEDFAALRAYAETMEIPANPDFSIAFTGRVGELVAIIKHRLPSAP